MALAVLLLSAVAPIAAPPASAAPALPTLVVNEVDASGAPQDWIELKNTGTVAVDASGLILKDDKDADRFDIPANTIIAAGGYATFDVGTTFGLGAKGDAARLYLNDNATLIDGYTWTSDASPATWGRCLDGAGSFAITTAGTKGAANNCTTSTTPPTSTPTATPHRDSDGHADGDTDRHSLRRTARDQRDRCQRRPQGLDRAQEHEHDRVRCIRPCPQG